MNTTQFSQWQLLRLCWPLMLATFAVGTDAWVVGGFLPALARDLHVSVSAAGQSVTLFAVVYALAAPVLATLLARWPRRRLLLVALLWLAASNLLSAFSPTFGALLGSRVLAALAASLITPSAGVLVSKLVSAEQQGRALALVIAGLTLATALGVPLASALSQWASWRVALGLVAGLSALSALLVRLNAPEQAGTPQRGLLEIAQIWKNPAMTATLLLTMVGMTAAYCAYAYSAALLDWAALPARLLPILLSLYGLGALAGSLSSGTLTDQVGSARVLALAYSCMALAMGLAVTWHSAGVYTLSFLLWGFGVWMQTPAQQKRLLELAQRASLGQAADVLIALNASMLYLGVALGSAAGGGLLAAYGARAVLLSGAALAALAFVVNAVLAHTIAAKRH